MKRIYHYICLYLIRLNLIYHTYKALISLDRPKVKVIVFMCDSDNLDTFLHGSGELEVRTNFNSYEIAKLYNMLPKTDDIDLALMKAREEAINESLI